MAGEIDLDHVKELRHVLNSAAARSPAGLDLDLAAVSFCDCVGLSVLLGVRVRCLAAGGVLRLVAAGPRVQRLLELTGTAKLFAHSALARRRHPWENDGSSRLGDRVPTVVRAVPRATWAATSLSPVTQPAEQCLPRVPQSLDLLRPHSRRTVDVRAPILDRGRRNGPGPLRPTRGGGEMPDLVQRLEE
ncbi:STAS domain-containing protein [Kitasatospora sp. NPDC056138]|uniref:STAS domain-containing protein n=1 Tax=Kitasatospora sp. NPDC056138 TaxID=3345724 RepID=UPI0035DE4DB9